MNSFWPTSGNNPSESRPCLECLNRSYPAVPASVAAARQAVGAAAVALGATDQQVDGIRLAVSEAVTNSVLHAYGERPGQIHLRAAVGVVELWVTVADDGGGLRPLGERSGLGLGLALIANACDELAIVTRAHGGTEVRMRFRVGSSQMSGAAAVDRSAPAVA